MSKADVVVVIVLILFGYATQNRISNSFYLRFRFYPHLCPTAKWFIGRINNGAGSVYINRINLLVTFGMFYGQHGL